MIDDIQLLRGDITKLEVGAIVNAANTSLSGGGAWMEPFIVRVGRPFWKSV